MAWDDRHSGLFDRECVLQAVQVGLRAALAAAPWPHALTTVATDILADLTRVLGGRLTPWALFPLCCGAAGGGDWRDLVPAAVACEFYATALDLLDDAEDGDMSVAIDRYGVPTVINVATALLALAHTSLQPDPATTSLTGQARHSHAQAALWEGLAVATGGQHLDLSAAGGDPLSTEECLDIARRKGGALVEACCRVGAMLATDDTLFIDRCGALGRSIGLYAQLDNDMHDAADTVKKTDLARLTQTIPLAAARARRGPDAALSEAVWQGGIQLAYALKHAEMARARAALEEACTLAPDPAFARAALGLLMAPRGQEQPGDTA